MSAESQQSEPVEFVAVDLYERLLTELRSDPASFNRKYSVVMRAAVEHYGRAHERAGENAKVKAGREGCSDIAGAGSPKEVAH